MHEEASFEVVSAGPSRLLTWAVVGVSALAVLAAMFALGKASVTSENADDASPSVSSPAVSTPVEPLESDTALEPALGDGFGEVLGNVVVLSDTTFANGVRALVVCNLGSEDEPGLDSAEYVQLETIAGRLVVVQRIDITLPTSADDCGACEVTVSENLEVADPVIYGACLDGGTSGHSTAFVIASSQRPSGVALAMMLTCEGTQFVEEVGALVLESHALRLSFSEPVFRFPKIRFEQSAGGAFAPVDEALLRHYCRVIYDGGLVVSDSFGSSGSDLPYELIETSVGVLGQHSPVLIGLEQETCDLLFGAIWENNRADEPRVDPIAAFVEIESPAGFEDWHVTCQAMNSTTGP